MAFTLTYNGTTVEVPAPSSFEPSFNPQSRSAERNTNGNMVRNTLPDKWTLKMEWKFSSKEELYAWFNILKSITRINFSVTFPAPTGNDVTATFYISPISASMLNYWAGYDMVKCSFVEV